MYRAGGKVDYNPGKVFLVGREEIELLPEASKYLLPALASRSTINLLVSHEDCVSEAPPCATRLARSKTTTNEILIYDDKARPFIPYSPI